MLSSAVPALFISPKTFYKIHLDLGGCGTMKTYRTDVAIVEAIVKIFFAGVGVVDSE